MRLESHGNLARHPKTRRLMQRMGWTLPFTIGNLHLLWWWALEYAPTGDLTRFEPEQITYDLDLGTSTPEEFLEAMIQAGFIDRPGSGSAESRPGGNKLLLHDWPDYTSRYLRSSKFRRRPEVWHDVLRSYGRPIPPKRQRRTPSLPGFQLPPAKAGENQHSVVPPRRDAPEPVSSRATRDDQMVEYEPPGAARIDCIEDAARQGEASGGERNQPALRAVRGKTPSATAECESDVAALRAKQNIVPPDIPSSKGIENSQAATQVTIPQVLDMEPGFTLTWWPKYLAIYRSHGYPFNAYEATQVLAKLAEHPSKAVSILKNAVKTLTAHPERTRPGWNKNPTAPSGLTNNTT